MLAHSSNLADVANFVIGYVNLIIPVLTAIALALFLYAGVRYIFKAQDAGGKGPEREALIWGIVALFVLVSVWGLVRIMCIALLGTSCGVSNPTGPTFHPPPSPTPDIQQAIIHTRNLS